jgi:hypothetical protein
MILKELLAGLVGKAGGKAVICYQFATKILSNHKWVFKGAEPWGIGLFLRYSFLRAEYLFPSRRCQRLNHHCQFAYALRTSGNQRSASTAGMLGIKSPRINLSRADDALLFPT